MCRRINSLSRKVRISVLRFRERWQRSLANFRLNSNRHQFPYFEIFIFTRVPICLPFFFDLTRFLTVEVLLFASSILGLSILRKKPKHSLISYLLGNLDRTTLAPRVSQVPNLVPRFSHPPAPWSEVAWSSGSSPLFKTVGVFNRVTQEDARFSKSVPHRRYRR